MTQKLLLLLFIFAITPVWAQIKGVVLDKNGKPVPYVNIWFEKGTLATTSEENGNFSLEIKDQERQLIFSALGYQTRLVPVTEAEKVVLSDVAIELEEVAIKRNASKEKKEIGYYESGGFRYHIDHFISAVFFDATREERSHYPFIGEIKFRTLSENKNAKIRMYLVAAGTDGAPTESTLTEEVVFEVKKGNSKNLVDLSDRRIEIPENGFFVVFEKMKIEQNKHYTAYYLKDKNGNKTKHKGMSYEPEIPLAPVKEAVGWYKRTNNKWERSPKTMLDRPNSYENLLMKKYHDSYLVPAVDITITN